MQRSFVLFLGITVAIYLENHLDRAIAIAGVVLGMSNALFIPAFCHYKLVAETKSSKVIDIVIMCVALTMFFVGPFCIIRQW